MVLGLGYSAEMPVVLMQSIFYLGVIAMARLARPSISKLCYRRVDKSVSLIQAGLKLVAIWSILAAYIIPFFLIPHTVHPLLGWSLYLLGAFALSSIAVNAFLLPILPVLMPWLGILGALMVMACPWYPDGVMRALAVFGYAFCCAPVVWASMVKIMSCLQVSLEREAFLPRLVESTPAPALNKLY
ncbi:putative glucuronosyltransferase pgsip8 [Sarracenia purpurea var. burkii]